MLMAELNIELNSDLKLFCFLFFSTNEIVTGYEIRTITVTKPATELRNRINLELKSGCKMLAKLASTRIKNVSWIVVMGMFQKRLVSKLC